MLSHFVSTGQNLLDAVFDSLTLHQLKTLKIKTNIQRSDSFMALSNICSCSRKHLLGVDEKTQCNDILDNFTMLSAGQYIYNLDRGAITDEQEKLVLIDHRL